MRKFNYTLVSMCIFSIFAIGQLQARNIGMTNSVGPIIQASEMPSQNIIMKNKVNKTLLTDFKNENQVFNTDCDKKAMNTFGNAVHDRKHWSNAMRLAERSYRGCMTGGGGTSAAGSWTILKQNIEKKYGAQ